MIDNKLTLYTLFVLVFGLVLPSRAQFEYFGLEGKTVEELRLYNDTLYAATRSGLYLRDLETQNNWELVGLQEERVNSFLVFSTDTILAGTQLYTAEDSISIYRTMNGGQSWEPYQNGFGSKGGTNYVIDMTQLPVSEDTLFATGAIQIQRSSDRGKDWKYVWGEQGGGSATHFVSIYQENSKYIYAGGETGFFSPFVLTSTDTGGSWTFHDMKRYGDNAVNSGVVKPTDPKIFYAGMEGRIEKTTDGGGSWEIKLEPDSYPYFYDMNIDSNQPEFLYAVGAINRPPQPLKVYWSVNGGDTWQKTVSDTSWSLGGIKSLAVKYGKETTDNILYLGTFDGGVFRYHQQHTYIKGRGTQIPSEIRLKQNYPNPFNPTTNIRFELPESNKVQLTVYNSIGQKVSTLINKKMNAGSHSVTFNASGLPSGVYIYRLKADGFSESGKMLLVK